MLGDTVLAWVSVFFLKDTGTVENKKYCLELSRKNINM